MCARVCACECVRACVCVQESQLVKPRMADEEEVVELPPAERQRERERETSPCHNLCLKKHESFSAQQQRWHFMFTTIISLVKDSCGCGTYESFKEQTEVLTLSAASCNIPTVSGTRKNRSAGPIATFQSSDWFPLILAASHTHTRARTCAHAPAAFLPCAQGSPSLNFLSGDHVYS